MVSVSTSTTPSKSAEKLVTTAKPASCLRLGSRGPISTTPGATDALPRCFLRCWTSSLRVVSATPVVH
jgi:hypothetical protein